MEQVKIFWVTPYQDYDGEVDRLQRVYAKWMSENASKIDVINREFAGSSNNLLGIAVFYREKEDSPV